MQNILLFQENQRNVKVTIPEPKDCYHEKYRIFKNTKFSGYTLYMSQINKYQDKMRRGNRYSQIRNLQRLHLGN